jgi:hypothetical protein
VSSHVHHPDVHIFGLQDDCPRCLEHAEHPFEALDPVMLSELNRRVRLGLEARSATEGLAMQRLQERVR